MRILMLIPELGYGGAEGAFIRLARELAARHTVELVVFQDYSVEGYTAIDLPIDFAIHHLDNLHETGRIRRWIARYRNLRALKKAYAADATISFLTGPNLLNVLARGHGRTIVSIRGTRRYDAYAGALTKWLYRSFADPIVNRLADAIICVSEGLTREVAGKLFGRQDKFHTISGYVDPERLASAAEAEIEPELAPLADFPVVVSAGRLSREKGFQHLIRVFAGVRRRIEGSKLLLIGDGPDRAELERLCGANGLACSGGEADLSADVIFLGYRADPNRYFRLGRLFVLPSANEGFPNILVEALAAGVAVAAGDVPWGSREVLGVAADPQNRPYPRNEPLETEYGMLMPPIADPTFHDEWVEMISDHLTRGPESPSVAERRQARVEELSCKAAAAKWCRLLESLQR